MFESPYTGRDFVQFGKTKSVLNKRAQGIALLFNPPLVLSLEIFRIFGKEGDGWLLLYKRLAESRFQWTRSAEEVHSLTQQQFRWLMEGLTITPKVFHVDYNTFSQKVNISHLKSRD